MTTATNTTATLPTLRNTVGDVIKLTTLIGRTTLETISITHQQILNRSDIASTLREDSLKDIFNGEAKSNDLMRDKLNAGMNMMMDFFNSDTTIEVVTKDKDKANDNVKEEEHKQTTEEDMTK